MKRIIFLLVITTGITNILYAQTDATRYWTPEQTLKMKNITSVVPSPDGSKVLYTVREAVMTDDRSEYVNQVFLCQADGSNTIQLTKGEKNSSSPKWSPNGKWISFTSARDGKNNLYLLAVGGGESEKLTDLKGGVGNYEWSSDGNLIAFTQSDILTDADEKNKKAKNDWYFVDEDIKQSRLYILYLNDKDTTGKRKVKKLTEENYNINGFDWSPDSKSIAFSHGKTPVVNDNVYSDLSMIDVASGKTKVVANTAAGESNPSFSPDGKHIVYYCSEAPVDWSGPEHARIYSVADGKTWKLGATPNEDGGIVGWTSDSRYVIWQEPKKTLVSLYLLGLDGKEIKEWTDGNGNYISAGALNSTGTHLGMVMQRPDLPGEAYITPLATYTPVKISNIHADLANKAMPRTELIKWKTFDGKEIEGLLTYPLKYESGKKYPFILNIHGGPAGVFQQTCVAGNSGAYPIAALSEMGMFVLRPNPRGSTGYGTAFRTANRRDWGGGDYKDLMAGVDHMVKTGMIDADRMGVMGWSYGGFMSSWVVTHTDRFKAASIGAPVVDLAHQNLTDDIAGFLPSYMNSEPWNDWAVYDAHSPLRFVQNVKTPVMLQHCEGDQRVPISNATMFYRALKRRNVPVRMLAMPRQGHGPVEPKMVLKTMQTNVEWFSKYLSAQKGF